MVSRSYEKKITRLPFTWSEIKNLPSHKTYRAKVFGGWLVSTASYCDGLLIDECLVFVPDGDHQWEIANEE